MINEINKVRKAINDLKDKDIIVLDIDIVYELDCQLGYELKALSDDDYCKLFNEVKYAYIKVEGVDLCNIVMCAIDHLDDIINEDKGFDLREECCWYA